MSHKNNFKDFINFYVRDYYSSSKMNNPLNSVWNLSRKDYLKQYNSNRKSFLLELEEIEATSVSNLVPKEFFSKEQAKIIFIDFLKDLLKETNRNKKQILTIDSCSIIAEQKEEYEIIKRNLVKYIDYIMNKNFYLIRNSTKSLNSFYLKIEKSLTRITELKKRFKVIKNNFFIVNSKIYLKKQKLINCKNIYNNLIKLREYKRTYLSITSTKTKNLTIEFNNKSNLNKNLELIKKIEKFKYYNKSLICFWFIQNLKIKKKDCIDNCEELLSKIFLTKINPEEFNSLYDIFSSMGRDNTGINKNNSKSIDNELLFKLIIFYKKNILNVFKGILLSYATIDYTESINSNTILKLKQLQLLSFEEKQLFLAINQICLTIISLCDNLKIYIFTKEYKNTKLGQLFYINRKRFYDILNKKLRKILFLYTELLLNFKDKKYIFLILSSFSLIYCYIEKTFLISNNNANNFNTTKKVNKNQNIIKNSSGKNNSNIVKKSLNNSINSNKSENRNVNVNEMNVLKKEIYNFFIKLTDFELKQDIKNLALLLNKDNWKKINIINLNDQINKRNIKVLKYKFFLNLPFGNINIEQNEIKKQIINLPNFKESNEIKLAMNKLLNKKLNERNLVFSTSSLNLLFYIFEFISFGLIIPIIRKKTIIDIFNLYDYFIYSSLLMFDHDKINIKKLKQKSLTKNINNNKNHNELSFDELIKISKEIAYYQNYLNLIPYMYHCQNEVLIKIIGDAKLLFTVLPSLSPKILKNNNDNDKNNINKGNFIEKIICFESYWSLFKIIKRLLNINKGKDTYLSQINKYKIILNEIKYFLYSPISLSLIKDKSYINNFINNNWEINSTINNESNIYIQIIFDNLKEINEKLNMFLPIALKSKARFLNIILFVMINNIRDNFDKIKKINKQGLNIMIQDFKRLYNQMPELISCNDNGGGGDVNSKNKAFNDIFNNLYEFFNLIVINEKEFLNNVGRNKIPLYLVNILLNLNKSISKDDKKKIKVDLKCICLKEIEIIDKTLSKYN